MHKIIFFEKKKMIKKIYVPTLPKIFRPYLKFSDPLPETDLLFYLAWDRGLKFGLSLYLGPYFVCARNNGSG